MLDMNVLKFTGGLGNQLFQYAFLLYCQENGVNLKCDFNIFDLQKIHEGFLLNDVLKEEFQVRNEISCAQHISVNDIRFFQRIQNSVFHCYQAHYFEKHFKNYIDAKDFLLKSNGIYMDGYWQNVAMVQCVINELKRRLKPAEELLKKEMIQVFSDSNSVSIHVRRGDYMTNSQAMKLYGNICTNEYYMEAIHLMKKWLGHPNFFVFSDDLEYAKELFRNEDKVNYVTHCMEEKAYTDLMRMSLCKNIIIANSSFSWWGAMLGERIRVIMPEKWNNQCKENVLIIPGAVRINENGQVVE